MKCVFIINPVSGRQSDRREWVREIKSFLIRRKWQGEIHHTAAAGHATELALNALALGSDMVIAVGGDGTFNETARALVDTTVAVGLIPGGSGNGLARHLGIPLEIRPALESLANGRTLAMDSGVADGHPFFNVMGLGFDAMIGQSFNNLSGRGPLPYFTTSAAGFLRYKPEHYCLRNGNHQQSVTAWVVAVGNGSQYGNNARITPRASVVDGRLDLCALQLRHRHHLPELTWRLFRGTLDRGPGVLSWQGDHFLIEREKAGILHTDGEIHPSGTTIEITVRPKSLNVRLPQASDRGFVG